MDKYLKMSYAFKRKVSAVEVSFLTLDHHNRTCDEYAAHSINSHDELVAEVERLRQALIDAATSLETIHVRSYGEDSFLDSKQETRSYAGSRAKIARAALSEQ